MASSFPAAGLSFSFCRERYELPWGAFALELVSGLKGFSVFLCLVRSPHLSAPPFLLADKLFLAGLVWHPQNGESRTASVTGPAVRGLSPLASPACGPRATLPLLEPGLTCPPCLSLSLSKSDGAIASFAKCPLQHVTAGLPKEEKLPGRS